MSKSGLIISVLFTAFLLLIFFLDKGLFSIKKEAQIKPITEETPLEEEKLDNIQEESEVNGENLMINNSENYFQAGMNILIYGHPDMLEVKKVLERLKKIGINSIAINFPFYQSDWQANEVTTSQMDTPTNEELKAVIKEAHDLNISVMIRPIMDEQAFLSSNMWRGQIKPKNPEKWFDSYEKLILTYAMLAEESNAKFLNIGTELNSMQNKYQNRWIELIENVRHVYKGKLLYSFNYDTVNEIPSLKFIKFLDHIGLDAYFPLELPDNASVEMLEKEWEKKINQIEKTLWQNSIIVTEAGIIPIEGAYRTPYAWSIPNKSYDPQAQVNYYEATYNVWKPKIDGMYWWAVTIGQDPNEISYSPLFLPTENVIKKQFQKDY